MAAQINEAECTGCGECVEVCPVEAIEIQDEKAVLNQELCIDCRACEDVCPTGAIKVVEGSEAH